MDMDSGTVRGMLAFEREALLSRSLDGLSPADLDLVVGIGVISGVLK